MDHNGQSVEKHFSDILDFINKSQLETNDSKKNILIHCFMGSSRSASCVILYLMNIDNNFLKLV